jgi:hypothetical protein
MSPSSAILLAALLPTGAAMDQTHCVDNLPALRAALQAWTEADSGSTVEIRLVQGEYAFDHAAGLGLGDFWATTTAGLRLLGGFEPGCTQRKLDARNTVIDGRDQSQAGLRLLNIGSDVLLEGLSLTGLGNGVELLYSGSVSASGHRLRLSHCRLVENDGYWGETFAYSLRLWGFGSGNSGAEVALENSLIAHNSHTGWASPVVLSTGQGGRLVLSGNTVAHNQLQSGGSAVTLQTWAGVAGLEWRIANNIVWGNLASGSVWGIDLLNAPSPPLLLNTLSQPIRGAFQDSEGNRWSDPRFVDPAAGDFRLQPDSPARDAGTDQLAGGLAQDDLFGAPRVQGDAVDLGAIENAAPEALFGDGFEPL